MLRTQTLEGPMRSVRVFILAGAAVIAIAFFGFGAWAAIAPLASAAIANGQVGVSSRRQTIQHLEGGIIAELRVRDGDTVAAGDLLVRLDDTRTRAAYEQLRSQYLINIAERARLEAERDGLPITWPAELVSLQADPAVAAILAGQVNVSNGRRDFLEGQKQIVKEKRLQLDQEIEATTSQLNAGRQRAELISKELAVVEDLVQRGLDKLPRLLALQRSAAELAGNAGDLEARIARSKQAKSELLAQLNDTRNRLMNEVVSQLRDTEGKIADLSQRMLAAKDVLGRLDVRAPRAGTVVNLLHHTVGGVVQPGQPLMDLVPTDDRLVIEVRLDPKDIDVLKVGLPAEITLTPYSARSVPPMQGTLVLVSADALIDPKNGISYYSGRVEVDPAELAHIKDVRLIPGMPALVMIKTGDRTALTYFIDPFRKSIHRAFREK